MPIQLYDEDGEILEGMYYEDFVDPDNPGACKLMVALNPYSTIINTCGYSTNDIMWKIRDAVVDAREDGVTLECSCGQCYEKHGITAPVAQG